MSNTTRETIVHFTPKSANGKTGPIPVTTSAPSTCPDSCPLKAGGCYAKGGPLGMHWRKVGAGRGNGWAELCDSIAALPAGQIWRHNQAGDLPGEGEAIDEGELAALVGANAGKRGFTYTHKPVDFVDAVDASHVLNNRAMVDYANRNGFTVNLSANDLAHADRLAALDIGPVAVVLDAAVFERKRVKGEWAETLAEYRARVDLTPKTPEGRPVVVCPATYRDDVTCESCGFCASNKRNRPAAGFPAHGASKRKASAIAAGK